MPAPQQAHELVRLEHVDLVYGTRDARVPALQDVTLGIDRGEFVAVVGPSGCGKSSLMRLISGLRPPSAGRIDFESRPITGPLASVGMAFQSPNLLPWRTALANVMLPLEIVPGHRGRLRAERSRYVEKAEALLSQVGLGDAAQRFPWELSGGMQQRTSICRALIHEPEILLLDEPFGALDAFTREELWCTLRDIHAARQVTVMLVTHDLREAVFLADTVYVMSRRPGRIVRRQEIPLPRPRDLDVTYTPAFTDLVQQLRRLVGGQH